MSVEQDFLPFATGGSANVLSQSAYASLGALATGFQSGVANSAQLNKVWRQSSIMSAVLAQFIVQQTGQPAIDDGTTATLLANLVAAVKAASNSVVGQSRNLVMNVSAASATATLTADEIIVESALGGNTYKVASFSKSINLATTGAGGMDTGTAPASGYVALYAIYNPTTGASALLATNATSAAQPNVYGGANMPSGYSASALVSVWPTNASSQFIVGSQYDRTVNFTSMGVYSGSGSVSLTTVNLAGVVPKNAKFASGVLSITVSTSGVSSYNIFDQTATGASTLVISVNTGSSNSGGNSNNFSRFPILTAQTWYISSTQSATINNMSVSLVGYEF